MTLDIRPATDGDLLAIAGIRTRAWQAAYRGLVPASYLDAMDPAAQVDRWRARPTGDGPTDHVLTVAGEVVGWAAFGPYRAGDAPAGSGEIAAIYLPPERWGQGLGRELMAYALRGLGAAGLNPVLLWVLAGNARARRFYERAGFRADGGRQVFRIADTDVAEIRYRQDRPAPAP